MGNKKVRRIVIISVICFTLVCVTFIIVKLTQNDPTKTTIKNYTDVVKNLPDDIRDSFEKSLYKMLAYNNPGKDISNIKDVIIRKDSNQQSEAKKGQFSGSFIVDIESLRQSYQVRYRESADPKDGFATGYPINVLCLDKNKLIYGDFDCKDMTFWQTSSDPLANKLPYSSDYYKITGIFSQDQTKPTIVIQVMINNNSQRTKERFMKYKDDALVWIKNQGVDLNNYTIEYRNFSNEKVILDAPDTPQGD